MPADSQHPANSQQPAFLKNLSKVLMDKKHRARSFEELQKAIEAANIRSHTVDRRKLARLAQCKEDVDKLMEIPLSLNELLALDVYLKLDGGLAAVFEDKNILRSLVEQRDVAFLLGAKPVDDTDHISRWDVRAMTEIQRGIYQLSRDVHMEIIDIYLRDASWRKLNPRDYQELFAGKAWYDQLDDASGPSCVCIGSPRACNAAELMLAKMLDVAPFESGNTKSDAAIPFKFVWSDTEYENFPSSFAARDTNVPGQRRSHRRKPESFPRKIRALIVKGTRYDIDSDREAWKTYGVIAVSRRPHGQLWVVCAGLSGTATFAASRLLKTIIAEVGPAESSESSTVYWYVVEARVERTAGKPGDDRHVFDERIVARDLTLVPTR